MRRLDQAAIGSERVTGAKGVTRHLYEIHGWGQVGVAYHPGSKSNIYTVRKARQADPADVAELHRRLGLER